MILVDIQVAQLGIKAIAHYGDMEGFTVDRFYKLYGKIVVDAHRLLKNSLPLTTYTLITKGYLLELDNYKLTYNLPEGFELCEHYDVGNLCYTYFSFEKHAPVGGNCSSILSPLI